MGFPLTSISKMAARRGVTVKDVPAADFIKKCADFLKRQPKFQVPKWADLVKTGHFKELAPYSEDWFYIRASPCVPSPRRRNRIPPPLVWRMPPPWNTHLPPRHRIRLCYPQLPEAA